MSSRRCPDFTLPATSGKIFTLSAVRQLLIIYFYPKDHTPGCTNESIAFRDLYPQFRAIGADIVGISRDSLKSHETFKAKLELPFELLSDPTETVCTSFNVIKTKTLYGKSVRGVERSTFIVNSAGNIVGEWRGVKVPGHANSMLAFAQAL